MNESNIHLSINISTLLRTSMLTATLSYSHLCPHAAIYCVTLCNWLKNKLAREGFELRHVESLNQKQKKQWMASTFTGLQTRCFSFVTTCINITRHRLDSLSGHRIFFRFRQVRKENEPINLIMSLSICRHKKTELRNTFYLFWYFEVLVNFAATYTLQWNSYFSCEDRHAFSNAPWKLCIKIFYILTVLTYFYSPSCLLGLM